MQDERQNRVRSPNSGNSEIPKRYVRCEMKILVLADIDDFHWKAGTGQADLVVSCGDVADQVIFEAAEAHAGQNWGLFC